jgi:purine-binding chemotaxis protein CheW
MSGEVADLDTPSQVLEFTLGDERYCVGIDAVEEIVKRKSVTPLPDTPQHIVGMMDLRGETTTIVNPKLVLETGNSDGEQFVVIFQDGDGSQIGWLVDEVHEVATLPAPDVEPAEDNAYVNGIVSEDDEFTVWIDPARVNGVASG